MAVSLRWRAHASSLRGSAGRIAGATQGGLKPALRFAPVADSCRHLLGREAEVLGDLLVRGAGAEVVDADHQGVVVDVLVPAGRTARLDRDDFAAIAEDFVLV